MDAVRWVVLILLFAGLFGLWLWSRRQAKLANFAGKTAAAAGFKVAQKRWLDQKTGICLVESGSERFLLAYTVGGGVSWQPVASKPAAVAPENKPLEVSHALNFENILHEAGLK